MTRTDNLLFGLLGLGWLLWLYNVVRYRGLSRTTKSLIAQNTRLIESNESLRWQNGSLLAELGRRGSPARRRREQLTGSHAQVTRPSSANVARSRWAGTTRTAKP